MFDLGIDFDLLISSFIFWNSKNSPINLILNFTHWKDYFENIIKSQTKRRIYRSIINTNLFNETIYSQKLLVNIIKFGDRSNNKDKNLLIVYVKRKDINKLNDFQLLQII